jgi:hypothetical protein
MPNNACPEEQKVIAALLAHGGMSGIEEHLDVCPHCKETAFIMSSLDQESDVAVPPAGLIYWKADLAARREGAERALRPARTMEILASLILVVLVVAALAVAGGPLALLGGLASILLFVIGGSAIYFTIGREPR